MSQITSLGKYHILEHLAADWMSEIYRVKTVGIAGFEKVQVLRKIHAAHSGDPAFFHSFLEEAKVAFSLNHRNIVQVFEFGKTGEDLFLAMEHIPGINLATALTHARNSARPVPAGLTCYLMGEVAAGLEYAHAKADHHGSGLGVVHCLLTPINVACSFEGSVKVLDFGVARTAWTMAPHGEAFPYDARYLSPEQHQGQEPDARSDLFSFGVILWELLTGVPLFQEAGFADLQRQVMHNELASPRTLAPEIPGGLEALTMACLERDPIHRAHDARALQTELHKIQRQLGAVIGSRALSTFLDDLFPRRADTQDARQDIPLDGAQAIGQFFDARKPAAPTEDQSFESLFLDRPGTLFPEDEPPDLIDNTPEPQPEPEPSVPALMERPASEVSAQPGVAGVLRTGRDLDEELSSAYPLYAEQSDASAVRVLGSDELLTDGIVDDRTATANLDDEEISILELGEGELEDDETLTPEPSAALHQADTADLALAEEVAETMDLSAPRPVGETMDMAAHQQVGETAPLEVSRSATLEPLSVDPLGETAPLEIETGKSEVETLSEHDTAAVPDPVADDEEGLAQRKRFIAVCLRMEGPFWAMEEATALISDIAYKMEGLIHEQSPGRAVVLFGLPTADELDIVAAVRFAIDCREAAFHLPLPAEGVPEHLAVRIGVRAGTARSSHGAWRHGYQLLGNVLEDTEALTAGANHGEILLEGLAARLAWGHYQLSGDEPSRGGSSRGERHRLVGPRLAEGQRQSRPGSLLVGREVEIRAVKSAWRECLLQGRQQCAMLVGEAGIGKSRLVDHFLGYFATDVQLLAARATPHRRGTPGAVLTDLLRAAAGSGWQRDPGLEGDLGAALPQLLGDASGEDRTAETLLSLVQHGPDAAPSQPAPAINPVALQRAMRKLINRMAEGDPVAVIVEDLHWADATSLDCLTALVQGAAEATGPILFLLTSRVEGAAQSLSGVEGVTPVLVDELHGPDRLHLIEECLGGERGEDADLVSEIARRAGGNPFYIRELCQAVAELDAEGVAEVPATVQRIIAGRVDRLPVQVKVVVQHAAMIGPSFKEPVLARFLGRNPARALGSLRSRGIIVPGSLTRGQADNFEREWTFRNMLIREVIYLDLGVATRRRLHRRVGEILASRTERGAGDPPDEVARHLELGGLGQQAAAYYLQAAEMASAALASPASLQLYGHALRLGVENPDLCHAAHAGRERVYRKLGWAAQQSEELQALGDLVGDDQARLADLRNREAAHLLRSGEAYLALAAAEQGEEAAANGGDQRARAEALRLRGEAYHRINDHERAEEAVRQALDLFAEQQAVDDQVRGLATLGRICLGQARYDEALDHFVAAQELLEDAGDRWLERILRTFQAVIHTCRGYYPQALGEAIYALKLCEEYGDRAREGDNATVVGIIHFELGLHEQAAGYLAEALEIHRETGSRWSEADTLVYLGLLAAAQGDFEQAEARLSQARTAADEISARSITIAAQNASAWMLCQRGGPGDGELAAEEGLAAAETARLLGLVVAEIPGLSRAAWGYATAGRYPEAMSLSRRAVELLADQEVIEGPEEEIFFNHHRILEAMGNPAADRWLARARQALESKLGRLDTPEWREAYTTRVALNREILSSD